MVVEIGHTTDGSNPHQVVHHTRVSSGGSDVDLSDDTIKVDYVGIWEVLVLLV